MTKREAHPFERTIGPGPYKFVGFGKIHTSETFGARYIGPECERGCGTCSHCGTGIMNIFVIRAGDGKNYGVGSDCIAKMDLPVEVKTAAQKAKRAHERELRSERNRKLQMEQRARNLAELEVFSKWWATDPKAKESWKKQPHPRDYMAEKGLSLFDYIEWCLSNGHAAGLRFYSTFANDWADDKRDSA